MSTTKNVTPKERVRQARAELDRHARPMLVKLAPVDAYLERQLAKVRLPGKLASLSPRSRLLSLVALFLVVVLLGAPFAIGRVQTARAEANLQAMVQQAYSDGLALHGSPTPAISLKDQYGQGVNLNQFKGHPVVLTFFDSLCPHRDCTLMADYLNYTTTHMTPQQVAQVDWVALSVNPWHDTRDSVTKFLQAHQMKMPVHYLMGTPQQMQPLWDALHMQVQLQSDGIVLHTTGVYVLDASGKEQLYLDEGFNPAALGGYLQYMLQQHKTSINPQQNTSAQNKNVIRLAKTVNGDTIHFTATPAQYGTYDFTIEVEDSQGVPVSGATASAVMNMVDMVMVPVNVKLSPTQIPGTYETKGQLSMRGPWYAKVTIKIAGKPDLNTTFNFTADY